MQRLWHNGLREAGVKFTSPITETHRAQFEANVVVEYDTTFGIFPKERHLRVRGDGPHWEYFRSERNEWRDVPNWLAEHINQQLVRQLLHKTKIVPLKQPAGRTA